VNYVYAVEQSELCLQSRTEKNMSIQYSRGNYIETIEEGELCHNNRAE